MERVFFVSSKRNLDFWSTFCEDDQHHFCLNQTILVKFHRKSMLLFKMCLIPSLSGHSAHSLGWLGTQNWIEVESTLINDLLPNLLEWVRNMCVGKRNLECVPRSSFSFWINWITKLVSSNLIKVNKSTLCRRWSAIWDLFWGRNRCFSSWWFTFQFSLASLVKSVIPVWDEFHQIELNIYQASFALVISLKRDMAHLEEQRKLHTMDHQTSSDLTFATLHFLIHRHKSDRKCVGKVIEQRNQHEIILLITWSWSSQLFQSGPDHFLCCDYGSNASLETWNLNDSSSSESEQSSNIG